MASVSGMSTHALIGDASPGDAGLGDAGPGLLGSDSLLESRRVCVSMNDVSPCASGPSLSLA